MINPHPPAQVQLGQVSQQVIHKAKVSEPVPVSQPALGPVHYVTGCVVGVAHHVLTSAKPVCKTVAGRAPNIGALWWRSSAFLE